MNRNDIEGTSEIRSNAEKKNGKNIAKIDRPENRMQLPLIFHLSFIVISLNFYYWHSIEWVLKRALGLNSSIKWSYRCDRKRTISGDFKIVNVSRLHFEYKLLCLLFAVVSFPRPRTSADSFDVNSQQFNENGFSSLQRWRWQKALQKKTMKSAMNGFIFFLYFYAIHFGCNMNIAFAHSFRSQTDIDVSFRDHISRNETDKMVKKTALYY